MKYVYVPVMIHSTKKDKDFFFIRVELRDESDKVISQSEPILWIEEDTYKKLLNIQ